MRPASSLRSVAFTTALAVTLGLALGCGSVKVKAKVSAKPSTEEPEEAAPPPKKKKKCESLAEKCAGEAGTRVRIVDSGQSIEPVSGWIYAQEVEATLSQLSESGPAFAAFGYETGKDEAASRDASLEKLVGKLGVTMPKRKIRWNKPLEVKEVGPLKISLWQTEGVTRGDKRGPLLVFATPLGDGKALLGIAFVPDDDDSNADAAILKSIETIAAEGSGS